MSEKQNEIIFIDDKSSLNGTREIVGPYLDMVCMSTGSGYNDSSLFFIINPINKQFRGIIKIEYNKEICQKYLYFSGFEELSEKNLHKIIKDINKNKYDFNVFKIKTEESGIHNPRKLTATSFIGVSYFKYQQLLASDDEGNSMLFEEASEQDEVLIG
jgi:hypothetical protein